MSAVLSPPTIPIRPAAPEPLVSFRQHYMIDGEPFVFISERWWAEQAPPGVTSVATPTPGQVLTARLIRARTGEVLIPSAVSVEMASPARG